MIPFSWFFPVLLDDLPVNMEADPPACVSMLCQQWPEDEQH